MRKVKTTLREVIEEITKLKGEKISMRINRGRKKFFNVSGVLENVYPSVFTVISDGEDDKINKYSYSYSDVLCGDVKILKS